MANTASYYDRSSFGKRRGLPECEITVAGRNVYYTRVSQLKIVCVTAVHLLEMVDQLFPVSFAPPHSVLGQKQLEQPVRLYRVTSRWFPPCILSQVKKRVEPTR